MLNPSKFEDLFANDEATFEVPQYQRAYAWKEKQINQLLTDLREQPLHKAYYLGHFLLERPDPNKVHYYIIDGQQRITTVAVFFSCLVQELRAREAKGENLIDLDGWKVETERWEERYLTRRGKRRFRTVETDDDFFGRAFVDRQIGAEPNRARQSQKRLNDAGKILKKEMAAEATATLLRWAHLLATASVSAFEESDKVRATQIFAFQNDRGADLTVLEKLKAYLMHQAYLNDESTEVTHTVKTVERLFADIYALTEEIHLGEDTVLRYHNVAFGSSSDAFENVKLSLRKAETKSSWITGYCDSLRQSFEDVRELERLANDHSHITGLLFLKAEDNWPLLLKIQRHHRTEREIREALYRLMEIVSFKLEFSTGDYRSHDFHGLAKGYEGAANELKETLREQASNGFRWWWNFTSNFHDKLDGNYHYNRVTRYLLWQYENWLRRKSPNGEPVAGAYFLNVWREGSWDKTLDHIAPQNPENVVYSTDFSEKRLHNLGNLALLMQGPNSRKKNKLPQDCIPIFEQSTYLADREIGKTLTENGVWGESEILARKQRIVDFAKNYWAVPED